MQVDVKYVPRKNLYGEKLYQYTLVDEYSRWCYREIHAEHTEYASLQFIRNAVRKTPFSISEVQTDNGYEFTNAFSGQKTLELSHFEQFLHDNGISYRRIRVGTPKHNGRVECQHGLDMLKSYKNSNSSLWMMLEQRSRLTMLGAILESKPV